MLDIKLRQMIANLSTVPAFGLANLIEDLISLGDKTLTLCLTLLLVGTTKRLDCQLANK